MSSQFMCFGVRMNLDPLIQRLLKEEGKTGMWVLIFSGSRDGIVTSCNICSRRSLRLKLEDGDGISVNGSAIGVWGLCVVQSTWVRGPRESAGLKKED